MRKLILLITFSWAGLTAQSISQVDYNVLPGNLIEVIYTLKDSEVNGVYNIEVYASFDGGYSFPVRAESVTGDVGQVRGRGRKALLWKVLDDLPALVSDNLVIKVVGRPRVTVGGFFTSLVAGNRFTKRMSDGVTFYGGNWTIQSLANQDFQDHLDNGTLTANGVVLTSSSGEQISSWYREVGHGLFTYYFLKGIRGEADRDDDRQITSTELFGYLMENVPYLARRKFNREQTPQLMGAELDKVLVRY